MILNVREGPESPRASGPSFCLWTEGVSHVAGETWASRSLNRSWVLGGGVVPTADVITSTSLSFRADV